MCAQDACGHLGFPGLSISCTETTARISTRVLDDTLKVATSAGQSLFGAGDLNVIHRSTSMVMPRLSLPQARSVVAAGTPSRPASARQ